MKALAAITVVLVVCLAAFAAGQMTGTTRSMPFVQAAEEMAQDAANTVHIDPETSAAIVDWIPAVFVLVLLEGLALFLGKSYKKYACIAALLVWLLIIGSMMMQ